MNNPYPAEDESEHIEDVPTLSAQFSAQRAILNAITQAKITDGTYRPQKLFADLRPASQSVNYLIKPLIRVLQLQAIDLMTI